MIPGNKTFHVVMPAHVRRVIPLALLAFLAMACGGPAKAPEPARTNGEWRTFQGTLNTTGNRQVLRFGPDRAGAIFSLSGSLLLVGERRLSAGFQCRIIGFNDNTKGIGGWSTWTDTRGDQVFSEIKGESLGGGSRILGTIVGGTGRYAGITGEYEYVWKLVVGDESADEGGFQGRADDVRGRFRLIGPEGGRNTVMSAQGTPNRKLLARGVTLAVALGLWFTPIPEGLTPQAWHLFVIFLSAILAVILTAFPLLTAAMIALAVAVISGTMTPAKAFSGFSNASVLLVVVAFLVARGVVKSGLGRRLSYLVVAVFGRSTLGLAYSIFLTDALIAPAFPSNTARGGVLFPIVLSLAQSGGSRPEDGTQRRMGGFLMFCGIATLSVSSALWLTATSVNPIGVEVSRNFGLNIDFGSWLVAASVPALTAILLLPLVLYKIFPPEVKATPEAPAAAREALRTMGPLSRDEKIVAVTFALLVTGWILAAPLNLNVTAVAFAGLGALLATGVLTLEDLSREGDTLSTFLWLAVLFTLSGQLNEMGFMGYVGERLALGFQGLSWPVAFTALIVLYVLIHYLFVSQSSQLLALFGVFLEVGIKTGVPTGILAFSLLFASSYFSAITPQGGSQNVIFVSAGYLTQGELYRMGAVSTAFCLLVFLVVGTPWLMFVLR